MPNKIVFLGTGGGGYMLVKQVLATGGIYLEMDGEKILIDPGSGSVVRSKQYGVDLTKLDLILLSHRHPDHAGDIITAIESMCGNKGRRGTLIVERNCVEGDNRIIDGYHEKLPKRTVKASPDEEYDVEGLTVRTTRSEHYSETVGFVIEGSTKIGYTSDGPYFEGQEEYFEGCDYLILNTMLPKGTDYTKHLKLEGAIKIIKHVKPELAVLTHFGFKFMKAGFKEQKGYVEDETGVETVTARDGMELEIGEKGGGLEKFTQN